MTRRGVMRTMLVAGGGLAALGAGLAARALPPRPISETALAQAWAEPLPPRSGPLRVYHLGHSLVGRDMPAMLAQLCGPGHAYASQLGWGASLRQHWRGEVPGFAAENAIPAHAPAASLDEGRFDALVLTEMVEIADAIRHHDSAAYLARWARRAVRANSAVRVYLYETWHRLDDPAGWLARIDGDLALHWESALLRPAMAMRGVPVIRVIPAGQALAAVVRAMEAGRVPGMTRREALFATDADGVTDPIHMGDVGNYVVALAHYAALMQRSPVGLPHAPMRADGTDALAMEAPAAAVVQAVVWDVVRRYTGSGVART